MPRHNYPTLTTGNSKQPLKLYLTWVVLGGMAGFFLGLVLSEDRSVSQKATLAYPFIGLFLGCVVGAVAAYVIQKNKEQRP